MRLLALLLCAFGLGGCGTAPFSWLLLAPAGGSLEQPPPNFGDAPPVNETAGPYTPSSPSSRATSSAPATAGASGSARGSSGSNVGGAVGAIAAGFGVAATAFWAATSLQCQPNADQPAHAGKVNLCKRGE